jgi:GNAT superfamily N-acetyltransferase
MPLNILWEVKLMLRKAEIKDSESIAKIIVETWKTAYAGIVDPEYSSNLKVDFFTKIMERNIGENLETIFVDAQENVIRGFISGVKTDSPQRYEIKGFYILPNYQGKGIGKALLNEIIEYAESKGYSEIYLETLKGARNNKFYTKQGFSMNKEFTLPIGNKSYSGISFTRKI